MFCNKCGTKLPDDSMFCSQCGARVHQPGTAVQQPQVNTAAPTPKPAAPVKPQQAPSAAGSVPPLVQLNWLDRNAYHSCSIQFPDRPVTVGNIHLVDNKVLAVTYNDGMWVREVRFPLQELLRVTVAQKGKLFSTEYTAVFYFRDGKDIKFVSDAKKFLSAVQNAAHYANAPMSLV